MEVGIEAYVVNQDGGGERKWVSTDSLPVKPCPFCGETAFMQKDFSGWKIHCGNIDCPAIPRSKYFETKREAILAWNTRRGDGVESAPPMATHSSAT